MKSKKDKNKGSVKIVILMGIIVVIVFLGICVSDDWQQKRFATLRSGYEYMENDKYQEAVEAFEEYLSVDSNIYWYFIELINDDSHSRESVSEAIEACKALLRDT